MKASRERLNACVALVIPILSLCSAARAAPFAGGTGEPNNPYQIATAEQLIEISSDANWWNKHFILVADIDLSAFDGRDGRPAFTMIGHDANRQYGMLQVPFSGVFDGGGHTISNLRLTSTGQDCVGLFGYVSGFTAEIRNVGLINPTVDAGTGMSVGSLVGGMGGLRITRCYAEGVSVRGGSYVGGLVGSCGSSVADCYCTGAVSGQTVVGGLAASNRLMIIDCYSTAQVDGNDSVGGLVGRPIGMRGDTGSLILNCYAAGRVSGVTNVGGLVGRQGAHVIGSYWDVQTSGQANSGGGIGKTTLQMVTAQTFIGWGAGDHNNAWTIDEGRDYPRLTWESRPGDPLPSRQLADHVPGTGAPGDPFLIRTADDLNLIGLFPSEWSRCFKLVSNVNMADCTAPAFNAIGVYEIPFQGVFDGNDHSISNVAIDAGLADNAGLFQYVSDPNAEIRALRLVDCRVTVAGGRGGALVAYLHQGNVMNCHGVNNVVSGQSGVGGLVGTMANGVITDCSSTGTVSGTYYVGGLVGQTDDPITRCSATAAVTGDNWVGGLVGHNDGTVTECWSASNVSGDIAGGLVGENGYSNTPGTVVNSYATGSVSNGWRAGGLVGGNAAGTILNCYSTTCVPGTWAVGGLVASDLYNGTRVTASFWDKDASGQTVSAGGMGKTTTEMKARATFINAGWDFTDTWTICEGQDYPRLKWEGVTCQP